MGCQHCDDDGWVVCYFCGGTGKIITDIVEICPLCQGKGVIRCPECNKDT